MFNPKYLQEKQEGKAIAAREQQSFTQSDRRETILEKFKLKLDQCTAQLRQKEEILEVEKAKRQELELELQKTKQELSQLKTKFDERLEEKVNRRTSELQLLNDLSRQIGYTLSYEDLFRSMLEHLHTVFPCDVTGGILIEGGQTCDLFLKTIRPVSTAAQTEIQQRLLDSLAKVNSSDVTSRPICLHHLNSKVTESKKLPIKQIGSHFLVPIIADPEQEKQIIGLLFVGSEKAEQFTEDHIRLLYALADRASISVQQLQVLIAAQQSRLENEKIRQALEKERELNELKSRVIRTISHEYRTPLTVISLAAELLETQYSKLKEEQRLTCFGQISSATQHMANLVDDVLFLDRVEAGEMEINPRKLDLVEFCQQLVEDFELLASKGQTIEFVHEGCAAEVYLDEKLLRQILTNLLSNAIKYSPESGTVHFQLICDRDRAIFRIQDSGIGIPAEDRSRLFDSFHRARNASTLPGTGLGLGIVKKCVYLHRGEIGFETEVDVGTTFIVKLPLTHVQNGGCYSNEI